jgi:hypothetical protein
VSFTLLMSGVIVGRSALETRDADRRVACGVFRPGLGYELAQPIFELYDNAGDDAEALARYRKARQALHLQLTSSSGIPVTVSDLHIRKDPSVNSSKPALLLVIQTDDPTIWQKV